MPSANAPAMLAVMRHNPSIDLISRSEPWSAPTSFHNGSSPSSTSDSAEGFFDYLRGALVDDQPLGPVD